MRPNAKQREQGAKREAQVRMVLTMTMMKIWMRLVVTIMMMQLIIKMMLKDDDDILGGGGEEGLAEFLARAALLVEEELEAVSCRSLLS